MNANSEENIIKAAYLSNARASASRFQYFSRLAVIAQKDENIILSVPHSVGTVARAENNEDIALNVFSASALPLSQSDLTWSTARAGIIVGERGKWQRARAKQRRDSKISEQRKQNNKSKRRGRGNIKKMLEQRRLEIH